MQLREITIGALMDFIASDFYRSSKIIPITPQRAISQVNNPYAQQQDVALILAIDSNEQLLGYIGIMPGKTTFSDERFYWNTCWWVDKVEGKAVAMPLFYSMLKQCNFNIIFFDLTPHTAIIVNKIGFQTKISEGVKVFLRFDSAQILPKKHAFFNYLKPLLYLSDFIFNAFNTIRLGISKRKTRATYSVIEELDDEALQFLEKNQKNGLVPFNQLKLNWIIQYPWLVTRPNAAKKAMAKKYYFSYITTSFSIKVIKIIENNTVVALVVATIRDGDVKLSYCFFEKEHTSQLTAAIFDFAIRNNSSSITTFNPFIANEIKKYPVIFAKKISKTMAYPEKLNTFGIENKVFQDGDGDAVFT